MATVADGGAVSLSGPPLPASATPASTSQCHFLAADGLGENPFEVASSSTDSGLAPLLLQALLGAPWSASAVVTQHVLVANGIPTIPKNLLLRIRRGEYVDFADLLPAVNPADQSSALRFSLLPGYEVVRRRRHNISTISEWMQAFIVYAAAVVSADPSMALEMLAYALTVILASQHFDGLHWRAYDTHYCINVAASGNRSWSNLDTDLYTPFFTGRENPVALCSYCDSSAHGDSDCLHRPGPSRGSRKASSYGEAPPAKRRPWPADTCSQFNARGTCTFGERCKYRHTCGECGGDHPARSCSSSKKV